MLIAALAILLLAGCRVGSDYQQPDLSAATAAPWQAKALDTENGRISTQVGPIATWWQQFNDPELVRLITQLGTQNLTLLEARQRVLAAREIAGRSTAAGRPHVDGTADAGSAATGKEAMNFRGPPPGQQTEFYSLGIAAAWELDLWGRVERLTRAADADAEVAVEDYHAAAVSLAADLATAYLDLRALQARLALLGNAISLQEQSAKLAESEEAAGSGTKLAVAQAQVRLAQTQAQRPPLTEAIARSENRIAVLLGRRPGEETIKPGGLPTPPRLIGLGLPAELIERRADIRRAIAAYRSAIERLGATEAERYPTLTLSGTLNVQSARAGDLLGHDAFTYNLGPSLRVPLFDGGRIRASVREQTARAEALRVAVERTLLQAIGEVESAAVGVVRGEERQQQLAVAMAAGQRAVGHADELYQAGLGDQHQVIAAKRELVDLQDQNLVARRDLLAAAIVLYRSLGGGWQALPPPEPESTTSPNLKPAATAPEPALETQP